MISRQFQIRCASRVGIARAATHYLHVTVNADTATGPWQQKALTHLDRNGPARRAEVALPFHNDNNPKTLCQLHAAHRPFHPEERIGDAGQQPVSGTDAAGDDRIEPPLVPGRAIRGLKRKREAEP
jgi:hypothetical protein